MFRNAMALRSADSIFSNMNCDRLFEPQQLKEQKDGNAGLVSVLTHLVVVNQNRKCLDAVLPSVNNLTVDRNPRSKDVPLAFRRNEFSSHWHPSFHGN